MARAGQVEVVLDRPLSDLVSVGLLTRVVPPDLVDEVIAECGRTVPGPDLCVGELSGHGGLPDAGRTVQHDTPGGSARSGLSQQIQHRVDLAALPDDRHGISTTYWSPLVRGVPSE